MPMHGLPGTTPFDALRCQDARGYASTCRGTLHEKRGASLTAERRVDDGAVQCLDHLHLVRVPEVYLRACSAKH
eukprot:888262-Rhodomonas_salina.1